MSDADLTVRWSRDGRRYFPAEDKAGNSNFWAFSVNDRNKRLVTVLVGRRGTLGTNQPPATDGKFLYFTWRDDLGDIWVMDIVQQE